jgi:hypothetical protein
MTTVTRAAVTRAAVTGAVVTGDLSGSAVNARTRHPLEARHIEQLDEDLMNVGDSLMAKLAAGGQVKHRPASRRSARAVR